MDQPPPAVGDWLLPDVTDLERVELREVLRYLNRSTSEGRRRAASDPATRSYLQAGLRLLARSVSEDAEEPEDPRVHPFLAWLSRESIVRELANEPNLALPRQGTVAALRDRWDPHSRFISELILVALVAENWSAAVSVEAGSHAAELAGSPFAELVHDIAYQDLVALRASAGFRIQLLASAIAQNEPIVQMPLATMYAEILDSWSPIYEATLERYGLRLRTGFTLTMLTDLLAAMAEGLALRMIGTPDGDDLLDKETRTSLLGFGALALLASVTTTGADGRSFAEFVADAVERPGQPPA